MRRVSLGCAVVAMWGCSKPHASSEPAATPGPPVDARPPIELSPVPLDSPVPARDDGGHLLSEYRYSFDWQTLRNSYVRSMPTRADDCAKRACCSEICLGPHEIAGLVVRAGAGRNPGTEGIVIDRGRRDWITVDWTVAVLDSSGHAITAWVPVEKLIDDDRSYAEVEAPNADHVRNHHVGMRVDVRLLEEKLRRRRYQ